MGKCGQYNYKGINAQSWAAMSLFLQYLRNPDFICIELESPKMEDFNLIFCNGRKIICEAKARKRNFSYSDLKKFINSVLKYVQDNDELLVICSKLSQSLKNKVENMKYFSEYMTPCFKSKGFKPKEIKVVSKVRFWNISEKEHYKVVYSLFGELLNFWLPREELEQKADSIIIKKIYEGSAKGKKFSKSEILQEIDKYRKNAVKFSGYFDSERVNVEKQLSALIKAIEDNNSPEWAEAQLSAISAQPNLLFYVIEKFKDKKIRSLEDWANLWNLNNIYGFWYSIYRIFENNLDNYQNRKYVLNFIEKGSLEVHNFYNHNFFEVGVVRIIDKILNKDKRLLNRAFKIVKKILTSFKNEYFYLKANRPDREYEKRELCKLLKKIYLEGTKKTKDKTYNLIISDFNLVEDEGEYSAYSPIEIFEILKDYLIADLNYFEKKFLSFINEISQQYNKFYKFGRKMSFDGWELMGGSVTFWGENYKIEDRHFVRYVLKPALYHYYEKDKKRGWEFIKDNCLIKDKDIDYNHPDFINRAVLSVILERYKQDDDDISSRAFEILKDFVLTRKGIPHKSEIIYQTLLQDDYTDEKKWKLTKVSTEHFSIPQNPFVEQIVYELVAKNNKEAMIVLNNWSSDPEFYKRIKFFGRGLTPLIDRLLDSSFDYAINLLEVYIDTDFFIKELDNYDAYKAADLLGKILRIKFKVGHEIINKIGQNYFVLSKNQQILLGFGVLYSLHNKLDDIVFIKKVFYELVKPLLEKFDNDINKIVQKFSYANAREAFVQFAEELAKKELIAEALSIIEIFIDDPDPFFPGEDPEDLEGKYSHHKKIEEEGQRTDAINSVRGWSAWTLCCCIVRAYLPKIMDLIKKLVEDRDYYVQQRVCLPLSILVNNRLCHMPNDKNILFFDDDQKKALEKAKYVEGMAFEFLDRILEYSPNVQQALAKDIMSVVKRIRTLNQKEALILIEKLHKLPVTETAGLILYYAEFRKNSFKDWKWTLPGLYDDLHPFDDTDLKIKLKEIMLKNSKTKTAFAWEFYRLTDYALRKNLDYEQKFKVSERYIKVLITEYDHSTFDIIYRFLNENIKQPKLFNRCYAIWKKCLEVEKEAFEKLVKDKVGNICWGTNDYNGNFLFLVYQRKGQKQFLDDFEFLVNYPKEVSINGIKDAICLLKKTTSSHDQVERIFNKLIERRSNFYDDKKQWLSNQNRDKNFGVD